MAKVSLDFSFSGLKAAVYRVVNNTEIMTDEVKADIAASFQATVARTFEKKIARAFVQNPEMRSLFFVGGVSANSKIREKLTEMCKKSGKEFFVPKKSSYSTDNAAMIGLAAFYQLKEDPDLASMQVVEPEPRLKM
jgi:N6-L-threonylcarbamoyladenine synthase